MGAGVGVGSGAGVKIPQPQSIRAAQAASARLFKKKGSFKGYTSFSKFDVPENVCRTMIQYNKKGENSKPESRQ
ncbi:hypothetical protein B5G38_15055 [Gemmiger sp. An87]|nr:hypothetical protein B5G38_15055 [Gemmiger sp. An87]